MRNMIGGAIATIRVWALLAVVLLVAGVEVSQSSSTIPVLDLILSCLAVATIVTGGFAINDYFDRELDKVVHPTRPLPSQRISPASVLVFAVLSFGIGLTILF